MNRIDLTRPDCPPLGRYGPHPVGVRTLLLLHPNQPAAQGAAGQTSDRILTVEFWYPAEAETGSGGVYDTILRDGVTPTRLHGRAQRDAQALPGRNPLVLISHGYPGNRYLLSPLAERLASHGYAVASIDHPGSTYDDKAPISDTLLHRPLDQSFVLNAMAARPEVDASATAVIGYSMGGYGALVFGGAGVAAGLVDHEMAPPHGLLSRHRAGSAELARLTDARVKAVVAFGPYGRAAGIWTAAGLAGFRLPLLVIAGSQDEISGYAAMRAIWSETRGPRRHLLTFEGAGHNAGAPMPAPVESHAHSEALGWAPFEHYADAVWDTVRMNEVSAHVVLGFLEREIRSKGPGPSLPDPAPGLQLEQIGPPRTV